VSAISPTDVWAAGAYQNSSGAEEPLILRWNGKAWKPVKSPTLSGATEFDLHGVSTLSATNAWAVGYYNNSSGVTESLVLHCNATTCTQVTSPAPSGAQSTSLYGVSVLSATSVWAAGQYENSSGVMESLILHCNDATCTQVNGPALDGTQNLSGVSAGSATNAWVVGWYENNAAQETLTLRCSSKTCKQVKSPNGS
jgi:hypothetical protein